MQPQTKPVPLRDFGGLFSEAMEMSFRELALAVEKLTAELTALIPPPGREQPAEWANHATALHVLESLMRHRFPAAAHAWFA